METVSKRDNTAKSNHLSQHKQHWRNQLGLLSPIYVLAIKKTELAEGFEPFASSLSALYAGAEGTQTEGQEKKLAEKIIGPLLFFFTKSLK